MSLEAIIQANTEALQAMTAAILAGRAAGVAKQEKAAGETLPPKAAAEAEQRKKAVPATAPAVVTYDDVAKPFLKLVETKGRDAAIAAIAPLKALNEVKGGEQHAGQYAELLAKVNAAMTAEAAAPAAAPQASLV